MSWWAAPVEQNKPDQENACICCGDIQNWGTEQVICSFDYTVEPEIAEYNDSMLKVRYVLDDDSIKVGVHRQVLTSEGKYS